MNIAKIALAGLRKYVTFEGEAPVHLRAHDAFIISGTLIEGIGNVHSDYDTYVICDERPAFGEIGEVHAICQKRNLAACIEDQDKVFLTTDYIPNSIHHFEVEYWTWEEVQAIAATVRREHKSCLRHSDFLYQSALSGKESEFLHRVIVGEVIHGQKRLAEILKLEELKAMFCYLLYRQTSNMYWGFKDILGSVADKQWVLAFETTRDYLFHQIRGLCHLYGVTNQKRRWTLVYLSRIDDPDVKLLSARVENIVYRDSTTEEQKQLQIYEMVDLCDEIVAIGRRKLSLVRFAADCDISLKLIEAEMKERAGLCHPLLEQEYTFRRSIYGQGLSPLSYLLSSDPLLRVHERIGR